MQEGKRPVAVGLMFSLGHSSIVVVGSLALAVTALKLQQHFDHSRSFGGIIGMVVSRLFLLGIALANLIILRSVYRTFVRVRMESPTWIKISICCWRTAAFWSASSGRFLP